MVLENIPLGKNIFWLEFQSTFLFRRESKGVVCCSDDDEDCDDPKENEGESRKTFSKSKLAHETRYKHKTPVSVIGFQWYFQSALFRVFSSGSLLRPLS